MFYSKTKIIWTLKELTECLRKRQLNKFDANLGVSGLRGTGKSTFLFKLFNSFKKSGFNPDKHQVYSQDDVIKLLSRQHFSFCWDDEAINSGYKREFQHKGQQTLIKVVTNYRDNFNIYASALPFFYSLDRDLRELIFMHIHIKERGIAIVLMPIQTSIHSQDPWDTKANIKIEEQENRRMKKNPDLPFRYQRLSTFAGYLYFGDMTPKQRIRYELIKKRKRAKTFGIEDRPEVLEFHEKMYKALIEKKLTKEFLQQTCLIEGKKYSSFTGQLNTMLKDNGIKETVSQMLSKPSSNDINTNSKPEISDLIG